MTHITPRGERLTMKEKRNRLAQRLKDPEWRRYGWTLASGKLLGMLLVLGMMLMIPLLLTGTAARADTPVAATQAPVASCSTAAGSKAYC